MKIERISLFLLLMLLVFSILQRPIFASRKSYIVYLGGHSHGPSASWIDYKRVTDSHYEFLGSFLGSKEKAKGMIFYSYTRHINGFAANLKDEEATEISKHPKVISVFLNQGMKLHTTRSWNFLGLERDGVIPAKSIWRKARFGEDAIIGNLDSGVWPESESFNDDGMGPIPSRWKGICQNGAQDGVRCNRKLIGARYFNKGYKASGGVVNASTSTARDIEGHGTHTLSTAGGGFVPNANIYGYANGTAKGGSPNARVAAYKVCWEPIHGYQCFGADIIAAFDMAIHDGVDVLSISLSAASGTDYLSDGVAIGSFHAVKNGIVVVCSAGNGGPTQGTVSNTAPWILTVGASTMDREFPSYVRLGNNRHYKGQSLSSKVLPEKFYPLISSVDCKAANASSQQAQLCYIGSLDPKKVKGKIVACLRGGNYREEKGEAVRRSGGAGMILANDPASGNEIAADAHFLPALHISAIDGLAVFAYINSTKKPVAYITGPTTNLNTKPAPFMTAFSSQGPNPITPYILKPDITAPGLNVLAAYSGASSPTTLAFDSRRVLFSVISGTSMSCPHVSGIVGLLKTIHPDWSPAAIRSAIMTTATIRDNMGELITNSSLIKATPFSYGAGHVRPTHAMDPGLVYDLTTNDYIHFLCAHGYNAAQIAMLTDHSYLCHPTNKSSILDLNYPSIAVPYLTTSMTIKRTVKNVGSPGTYTVHVNAPRGVSVSVEPGSLIFGRIGEEKTFTVKLTPKRRLGTDYVFGRMIWSDGVHHVRSPIAVSSKDM
ncbi:subtilisin-like protease SBT5.3 [Magnolia sinica]|uniref:subtilisin-like protease SBT5.3 n=1 Tax=Magnolia sinica TaxID=86752 RepID=UPI002659C2B7|nr:subtilisin-like protease SBT5.3 [Magnolia sinica]